MPQHMKTISFRLFFSVIALVISCHTLGAQDIVGTWEVRYSENGMDVYVQTQTFNEDGSFVRDEVHNMADPQGDIYQSTSHEEGKWKLSRGGKRLFLQVRPSSVNLASDNSAIDGMMKAINVFKQYGALTTLYHFKVVSCTQDELIIKEHLDEAYFDGDRLRSYVEVIYHRVN